MRVEITNSHVWADRVGEAVINLLVEERETKLALCQKENRLRKFFKVFLPFIKEKTIEDIVPEKYGITSSIRYRLKRYEIEVEQIFKILDCMDQLTKGKIDKIILDVEDLRLIERYG